jgi:hypothetical protein
MILTTITGQVGTDIIPPIDWLPNKYNYIDNEWVLDNKLNIAAVAI